MGHLRIRSLPDTAPWRRLVGLVAEGASAAEVAKATAEAAIDGLGRAIGDGGIIHTVHLLAKIVQAARSDDFAAALGALGLAVNGPPGVLDLTIAFGAAVEAHTKAEGGRTDLGEMARLAAVETLTGLLTNQTRDLFGTSPEAVKEGVRGFSTKAGFSGLFHEYFSAFAQRFLGYHLGRELSIHVGGNGRFASPDEHTAFVNELGHHCDQATLIVKKYAGDWFDKNDWLNGITPTKSRNFSNHCLKKLRDELVVRGGR